MWILLGFIDFMMYHMHSLIVFNIVGSKNEHANFKGFKL